MRRNLCDAHYFSGDSIYRITIAPFQPVLKQSRIDTNVRIADTLVTARSLEKGGKGLKQVHG